MKTNIKINTTGMVEKFENLLNEINNVQEEIKTKTDIRNQYIMNNANPVFAKIMEEINTTIKLIDSVFPLDKISELTTRKYVKKEQLINDKKYYIQVSLNLAMRQCELSYRGKEERTIINNRFCANVTEQQKWKKCVTLSNTDFNAYTLTCTQFIKIFGTIDNIYIILDLFKENIREILNSLQEKLKKLQEQSDKILIPQLENTKGDDGKNSIVLGELDGYQIILQKKQNM